MRLEHSPSNVEHLSFWPWLVRVINGNLGFGDNIAGKWITYTSNATPDTQDSIAHGLKAAPSGFLVMSINKPGIVYQSAAFDATNLKLKCSIDSAIIDLFVVA